VASDSGRPCYRSTLLPVDDQWLVVGVVTAAAMLAETSVLEFIRLPLRLAGFVAATPDTWLPLLVVVLLMAGAVVLEARGRPPQRQSQAWYVAGAAAIVGAVWFFRAGNLDWGATADWVKEWTYHAALHESLSRGQLPWFLEETFQGTNRFFANPETNIAPQVLLLAVIDAPAFIVAQFVTLLGIGVAAAHRLARDLGLGPIASLTFLTIFLMNGHVIAHLETGHLQWAAYGLLPAVLLFVYRAARGDLNRRTQAGLAMILALIAMTGGWHVFVWCVIWIGVFVALDHSRWRFGLSLAPIVAGLIALRVVPALALYDAPDPEFVGSYQRLWILAAGLIGEARRPIDGLNWWEYNAFVGWVGFVVVATGFTAPLGRLWRHPVAALWAPSLAMLMLSTYNIYAWTLFRLPGFESERVASRLLILALLGFTLIGCVQLDSWLAHRRLSRWRVTAIALAGLLMAAQLVTHTNSRRPRPDRGIALPSASLVNDRQPETIYVASVAAGAAITFVTAGIAILMWRRSNATPGEPRSTPSAA
jgi:hypothetical protein